MQRRLPAYRSTVALALLCCCVSRAVASMDAPAVRTLTFRGLSALSARDVRSWMATAEGTLFSQTRLEEDLRHVVERCRGMGYLAADAAVAETRFAPDSSWVDLTVDVAEGKVTLVGRVSVSGMTAMDGLPEDFETREGQPMSASRLEQDIGVLLERYERMGYAFAQCSVAGLSVHQGPAADTADVALAVDEGMKVTIHEIRVEGVRETDPGVVVRETRIVPGEVYDPQKAQAIQSRLNRLNIFASVDEPELFVREGQGGVLIRVREGNTNTFDGLVGYIPASSTGASGYFTGLVSVAMRNLFGTGRRLQVRWQRDDRYSQEIALRYGEPWVGGIPVNLGGAFFQRQQDTAYVRRVIDLDGEFMLSEDISLGLAFSSERVIPSEDTTAQRVSASSSANVSGLFRLDSRDDPMSPASGVRLVTEYRYGQKRVSGSSPASARVPGKADIQRIVTDLELYASPFRRQVVALALHGRQVRGDNVEESEMFRFGGTNSLRGYRENQFLGTLVGWTNAEYRLLLARRSYAFTFFDTGYYRRPADPRYGTSGAESFTFGYGLGIRLETAIGNLGVSFALGRGDAVSDTKVHVGIASEF